MKLVADKAPDIDTIIDTWRQLNPNDDWFKHFDQKMIERRAVEHSS
jgi:hypothetical protein